MLEGVGGDVGIVEGADVIGRQGPPESGSNGCSCGSGEIGLTTASGGDQHGFFGVLPGMEEAEEDKSGTCDDAVAREVGETGAELIGEKLGGFGVADVLADLGGDAVEFALAG